MGDIRIKNLFQLFDQVLASIASAAHPVQGLSGVLDIWW